MPKRKDINLRMTVEEAEAIQGALIEGLGGDPEAMFPEEDACEVQAKWDMADLFLKQLGKLIRKAKEGKAV